MSIELKKISCEDVDTLDKIQKSAFKRLYDIYNDERNPYLKGTQEMINWLSMDNLFYWKIYYNDVVCGGIAYYMRSQGEYYLARLFIDPIFQRKGIAKQAILLCENEFMDAKRYTLDFPVDQIANKTCYEGAGYTDTGKREQLNDKLVLAVYEKIV